MALLARHDPRGSMNFKSRRAVADSRGLGFLIIAPRDPGIGARRAAAAQELPALSEKLVSFGGGNCPVTPVTRTLAALNARYRIFMGARLAGVDAPGAGSTSCPESPGAGPALNNGRASMVISAQRRLQAAPRFPKIRCSEVPSLVVELDKVRHD